MREEINELDNYNVKTMHGKMESVLGFRLRSSSVSDVLKNLEGR